MLLLSLPEVAVAYNKDFGLGAAFGELNGITLETYIGETESIQAFAGYTLFPGGGVAVIADYLFHPYSFLKKKTTVDLQFYWGIGAKFIWFTGYFSYYHPDKKRGSLGIDHFAIGGRAVAGLELAFVNKPFSIFFDLSPFSLVAVIPTPRLYYDADFCVGFRYWF
ncbi:MAG: hypothetical protein FJ088_10475 [Deltaproteobacteria bacterium]|nr:hypothetical protein [Deltaproteobacteria bacterium]